MFYTKIETEIRDQVGTIRMNDSAKLNAVNKVMVEEINDALDQFSGTARAVILTGNGPSSGTLLIVNSTSIPEERL